MNQQINLYQPIFREERKLFSLKTVGVSLAIVLVALVAMWGLGKYNVNGLAGAVAQLKQQQAAQQRMAEAAGVLLDAQGNPAAMEEEVKTLSARLAERTNALHLLRSGAAGQPRGFAPRMTALARKHTEGVWLDHLSLGGGAGNLMLRGRTLDAALVPRYLQSLAEEPELSGARFDLVVMDRRAQHEEADKRAAPKPVDQSPTVRFSISSTAFSIPMEESGS